MTETTKPTPNLKLRHERDRRCWSQQEVADLVGTTPLNVGRWERGITMPGPHFRHKLCEIFEKSAQELGLVPEPTAPSQPSPVGARFIAPTADLSAPVPEPLISLWNV